MKVMNLVQRSRVNRYPKILSLEVTYAVFIWWHIARQILLNFQPGKMSPQQLCTHFLNCKAKGELFSGVAVGRNIRTVVNIIISRWNWIVMNAGYRRRNFYWRNLGFQFTSPTSITTISARTKNSFCKGYFPDCWYSNLLHRKASAHVY